MTDRASGVRFDLVVPMASWSEAGVAIRPTDAVPTWSAIVGLVGAAFGWGRDDLRLRQLAADYAPAIILKRSGQIIEDYHTVKSPEADLAVRRRARVRLDELSVAKVHTSITRREYVVDAAYVITLIALCHPAVVSPSEIVDALGKPVFPLSAGRRSCPIGRVGATVVTGEIDELICEATYWDSRLEANRQPSLIRERRDLLVGPRQFAARHECVA